MIITEISDRIYDLVKLMIAQQSVLPDVSVIRRYDNGPRPTPIYLAFNPNPNIQEIGKAVYVAPTDVDPGSYIQTYQVSVDIHEIGGDGQYLQLIKQMQYNLNVRQFLESELLSLMNISSVFNIPKLLDDDNWEKESSMEMIFAFTHVTEDTTTYIATVELNNNIGE